MSCDWNLQIILNHIIPSTYRVCFIPRVALIVTPPKFVTHVLQSRGAVTSISISSTDLLYYVEPLPLNQFIYHDTQTVRTWPETAREELFAAARRDIAVARRNLGTWTCMTPILRRALVD